MNQHLYAALAAILNALDEAGEAPRPFTDRSYSGVLGEAASVDADKESGRWVVCLKPTDVGNKEVTHKALRAAIRKEVADELRAWALTMPDYKASKSGTTGRTIALAAADKIEAES